MNACEERGISLFVPGVIYSNNKGEIHDFQDLIIRRHFLEDFLAPPLYETDKPPSIKQTKIQGQKCNFSAVQRPNHFFQKS